MYEIESGVPRDLFELPCDECDMQVVDMLYCCLRRRSDLIDKERENHYYDDGIRKNFIETRFEEVRYRYCPIANEICQLIASNESDFVKNSFLNRVGNTAKDLLLKDMEQSFERFLHETTYVSAIPVYVLLGQLLDVTQPLKEHKVHVLNYAGPTELSVDLKPFQKMRHDARLCYGKMVNDRIALSTLFLPEMRLLKNGIGVAIQNR